MKITRFYLLFIYCHRTIKQKSKVNYHNETTMIESATIKAAIATSNFGEESTDSLDETTLDYLYGILQDEDTYDDIDGLIETVQSLLGVDDRAVIERFVNTLAPSTSAQACMASSPLQPLPQPSSPARVVHTIDQSCEDDHSSTSDSSDDVTAPKTSQISKDQRKAARLQRKQEKKLQRQRKHKQDSKKSKGNNDEKENDSDIDLQTKVAQINAASAQELEDIDDYASAWQDIKSQAEASGGEIVWGGRGAGGRGVNRGLGAYRGKDAVVQNLTLGFGGRDLLSQTHLSISHGHRYGLMGQNGVGKVSYSAMYHTSYNAYNLKHASFVFLFFTVDLT